MTNDLQAQPPGTFIAVRARWLVLTAGFLGRIFHGHEMGLFPVVAALGGEVFGWLGECLGRIRAMGAHSVIRFSDFLCS